jgi:hypothetical protein
MVTKSSAIQQMEASAEKPASAREHPQRTIKLALFLLSFALSAAIFLAFDWTYSAALKRTSRTIDLPNVCRVPDPVRQHGLKPNCRAMVRWGTVPFEYLTNSIGLRDEKIREVPLADARPRILLLGDSFTEGQLAWSDSYVGRIAAHLPQYDFLNGGAPAYSPSNYLNLTRALLAEGFKIDEVIVFLDNTAAQYEAAFYRDMDASGAVKGPAREYRNMSWIGTWRFRISSHLFITSNMLEFIERELINIGYYHLVASLAGSNIFDVEWAAWTYRKVDETDAFPTGYAPLGLQAGLAKQVAKMTLLWQGLARRNIPLSVVVYPYPSQLVHDRVDSQQVRIWQQWCEGKCKRFISLYPMFFAAKKECPRLQPGCWYDKLFLYGDVHYSDLGNAMVADAIIQSLTEAPPVKRKVEN